MAMALLLDARVHSHVQSDWLIYPAASAQLDGQALP
jgi:hypothetical protein